MPNDIPPLTARRGVLAIFFVSGFVIANWVANVPAVKDRFELNDASLGLTLLAISVGSVLALMLAGHLVGRFGSRNVTRVATLGCCLALPIVLLVPTYPLLIVFLFLFGVAFSSMDVAMNAQAVAIEARYHRPIMSTFHALYSLGALVGAAVASLLLARGLAPDAEVILAAAIALVIAIVALRTLLPASVDQTNEGPILALPTGPLAILSLLAMLAMVSEGAINDWSAVYLRDNLGAPASLAATGFAAFSLAMTVGRFGGDWLRAHLSATRLVRASGLLSAACLGAGLLLHQPLPMLIGFAGVGLGLANLVPIVFSAAGRTPGVASGTGLAAVATAGYCGFLVGPPIIGFVSQATSLTIGLALIVGASLLIAAMAGRLGST
ncbi:MAG TPA: MFS transporter [Chloroflexota bacterium]|nr:MFS transporter [Chloroflexota bacterium]